MSKRSEATLNHLLLLRSKAGLTLAQLAERSGVDQATISRIEKGHNRPYLATLYKLAAALNQTELDEELIALSYEAKERSERIANGTAL